MVCEHLENADVCVYIQRTLSKSYVLAGQLAGQFLFHHSYNCIIQCQQGGTRTGVSISQYDKNTTLNDIFHREGHYARFIFSSIFAGSISNNYILNIINWWLNQKFKQFSKRHGLISSSPSNSNRLGIQCDLNSFRNRSKHLGFADICSHNSLIITLFTQQCLVTLVYIVMLSITIKIKMKLYRNSE